MSAFPYQVIDLTHPIRTGMPLWPGDPETIREPHSSFDTRGYAMNSWTIGEHTGTHVGAPSHRIQGGRSIHEFPASELLLPLHVVAADEVVTIADFETYEDTHGPIASGSCVALNTGWSKRWHHPESVFEQDAAGGFKWPGYSPDAVEWLFEERQVKVLATDAPDLGTGRDVDLNAGKRCAELGMLHLENLAHVDRLPATASYIFIGALPLNGGTGSPARVLGLVPE